MENASKALLIAAAVLIAIVLIALGIKLIKNVENTSKQADETGNLLKESTKIASIDARGKMKGLTISKEKFNDFYTNVSKIKFDGLVERIDYNKKMLKEQLTVCGYVSLDPTVGITVNGEMKNKFYYENRLYYLENENTTQRYERIFNEEIPKMLNENSIIELDNPLDKNEIDEKVLIAYNYIMNKKLVTNISEIDENTKRDFNNYSKTKWGSSLFTHFDDTGYIDKVALMIVIFPGLTGNMYK